MLAARKPDEALAWAERGRALDREKQFQSTAAYDLDNLHLELLTRLGREDEALEAAWADFRERPSKYSYDDLMKFAPKAKRREWREKAMEAAKRADLHTSIELFVETKETQRLAELVRGTTDVALENTSHYATEPAAMKLEKPHPELAARLWRAQAMCIVDAGKSKYYDDDAANLERARKCYVRAGLVAEWAETVRQIRAEHHRKPAFMAEFESIAAGAGHGAEPSFLERAKDRWGVGRGGRLKEEGHSGQRIG